MNAHKREITTSDELAVNICQALGLEHDRVYRVILDLVANEFPVIYVQMIGDSRLLDVDWKRGLEGVAVSILDDGKEVGE